MGYARRILGSVFPQRVDDPKDLDALLVAISKVQAIQGLASHPGWDVLTDHLAYVLAETDREVMRMAEQPEKNVRALCSYAAYAKAIRLIVGIVHDADAQAPALIKAFNEKSENLKGTPAAIQTQPMAGQFGPAALDKE
jgi:hypothetical protein